MLFKKKKGGIVQPPSATSTRNKSAKSTKWTKKRIKNLLLTIGMMGCLMAGWYTLMFPTIANLVNKIYNQNAILAYNNTMTSYSNEDIEDMLQKCRNYNELIYEQQQTTVFKYQGANKSLSDGTYNSLPIRGGSIGTINIPSLSINLSIEHGTETKTLQSAAGHVYGSSLPVDGDNVHSVISGHSALSTAKLFTDLTKLKEGDEFYITVLNQEYEYKIDQITVTLPEDEWQYEQVEEGKNYVTLYTCTPYGINTHRLLVRGELVGVKEVEYDDSFDIMDYLPMILDGSLIALIILAPFICVVGKNIYQSKKDKNKGNKNKKGGNNTKKGVDNTKNKNDKSEEDSSKESSFSHIEIPRSEEKGRLLTDYEHFQEENKN